MTGNTSFCISLFDDGGLKKGSIGNIAIQDRVMKKPIKISSGIVIIIAVLYYFGLRTPLLVNGIKKQIKPGQSVEQVITVLNGAAKKPDICCWQMQGTQDYICSDPKTCDFPEDQIKFIGRQQKIRLTVLFMGPGFLHTDFHVTFYGDGMVASISEVERWD
jgi:hypothetical protein